MPQALPDIQMVEKILQDYITALTRDITERKIKEAQEEIREHMMNNMGTIVAKIIQKCHTLDPHAHYSINIINGWNPNESK